MLSRQFVRQASTMSFPSNSSAGLTAVRKISTYGYVQSSALVFSEHGQPTDVLSLHTHSISPPHGTTVSLKFLASPVNPADINQVQGVYPSKPIFHSNLGTTSSIAIGGNEGCAEVISAGGKVSSLKKGDLVVMKRPSLGTWRSHGQLDESDLIKVPVDGLKPADVARASINPITAHCLLRQFVNVGEAGGWVLQNGANSAVGRSVIQLAKLWGYRTVNIVRDRENVNTLKDELQKLGADVVVTDKEVSNRAAYDEILKKHSAKPRLALDCVGGPPTAAMVKGLGAEAYLVSYGAMSRQPLALPASNFIFKGLTHTGFWVSRWAEQNPSLKTEALKEVLEYVKSGKLDPGPSTEVVWSESELYKQGKEAYGKILRDAVGGFDGRQAGKTVFIFSEN